MNTALISMRIDGGSGSARATQPRVDSPARRARHQIVAILTVGACVIGALWLIIAVAIGSDRDSAIEHARSETNNLSAAFQAEVEGKLDAVARTMDAIANHVRADNHFDIYKWAREHRSLTANAVQAIALISPNGKLLSTSRDANARAVDVSDRDYFRSQIDASDHGAMSVDGLYIGRLVVGRLSDQDGIAVSYRVEGDDGHLLGVLVASIAPAQLTVLHTKANIGARDVLSLIGFDGVIRARFIAGRQTAAPGAGVRVPLPVDPFVLGGPPQSYVRTAVLDHVTRLFSNRPLDRYPLYVSVGFDVETLLRPAAQHAGLIQAIGVIATLMLGCVVLLLVKEIRHGAEREKKLADEQSRLDDEVRRGVVIQERLRASEQRLRDFAVMASDWFWEQDADLCFTEIGIEAPNPALNGRTYIGKRRWEMHDTSCAPEYWAAHERDVRNRNAFRDFRFNMTGRDGTLRHVSINGIPVYDDAGHFAGYRGTGRDITTAVEVETQLRTAKNRAEQAENLLRDAVDSMSEGFVIFDQNDRLVMCNEAYRTIYAEAADLLVPGTHFEDIVRRVLTDGGNLDAIGCEEEWLANRMRQHRDGVGSMKHRVGVGSWILVTDRRMKNGGTAGLRVDITALKQTQDALWDSEARLERAQAIAGTGSWELDVTTGRYIWSKELYRIRGLSPEEFDPNVDNVAPYVHPDDYPGVRAWLAELIAGHEQHTREARIIRPGGEVRTLRVEGRAIRDKDGVVRRLAGTMQDITERRLIERQLAQAQKMEAIGNLTGGMAHDFNNGLGVIIGNLDLLARMVKTNGTAAEICGEARDAAVRCADLIRGLLAFARRQPLLPRQTDVNELVKDTARLLGRTLGEDIALTLTPGPALWPVLTDPAQLEAALINLATNARDAMPKGGQLRIATRNARLDAHYAVLHPDATPGEHVLIEVSDTGTGIAPDIVGHIFEPFFTTKEIGSGSGLGLAMVFGFVRQSGGNIDVYSEPGLGTTFRIYLPRAPENDARALAAVERPPVRGRGETVLLVEDSEKLRQVAARQLSELGYRVLEAESAEKALQILSSEARIDLLFTDVVMPGAIDGIELARLVGRLRPRPGILLASGFPAGKAPGHPPCPPEFRLLCKPYSLDDLARSVREALDGPREDGMDDDADSGSPVQGDVRRQPLPGNWPPDPRPPTKREADTRAADVTALEDGPFSGSVLDIPRSERSEVGVKENV